MATKTITIKKGSYDVLRKCKRANESFSDVIDRELGERIDTADDLLAFARRLRGEGRKSGLAQKRKAA